MPESFTSLFVICTQYSNTATIDELKTVRHNNQLKRFGDNGEREKAQWSFFGTISVWLAGQYVLLYVLYVLGKCFKRPLWFFGRVISSKNCFFSMKMPDWVLRSLQIWPIWYFDGLKLVQKSFWRSRRNRRRKICQKLAKQLWVEILDRFPYHHSRNLYVCFFICI